MSSVWFVLCLRGKDLEFKILKPPFIFFSTQKVSVPDPSVLRLPLEVGLILPLLPLRVPFCICRNGPVCDFRLVGILPLLHQVQGVQWETQHHQRAGDQGFPGDGLNDSSIKPVAIARVEDLILGFWNVWSKGVCD